MVVGGGGGLGIKQLGINQQVLNERELFQSPTCRPRAASPGLSFARATSLRVYYLHVQLSPGLLSYLLA